ncbi:DNA-binding protein Fis [Rubripirellula tenax]|uniref:DNA-binding protein Fis n=1 Tax=Rubripirellula tenax TaxID=2528015 RepID=A0A5C6FCH7_9BACT|nr:helix-turn-helix domain-containing protein [Rubripirellula tenax]TWU59158.1 DNA-binding protein Fis [Rubripirellula tenax]
MQPPNDVSQSSSAKKERNPSSQTPESSERAPWETALIQEIQQLLNDDSEIILDEIHERVDRVLFDHVLTECGGNISEASKRLGISRPTLRNRVRQLG